MHAGGAGIDEAALSTIPPLQKRTLWLRSASRVSFGSEVRMVSSAVGAKVSKRVIWPSGRMMPPEFNNVSLSLIVSHRTEEI